MAAGSGQRVLPRRLGVVAEGRRSLAEDVGSAVESEIDARSRIVRPSDHPVVVQPLPGAAAHAIEQKNIGYKQYPFFLDKLSVK